MEMDFVPAPLMPMVSVVDELLAGPELAVAMVAMLDSHVARLQAEQLSWLVAAASGHPRVEEILVLDPVTEQERTVRIADAVREEVACALRIAPVTAQQRIDTARLLAGPLAGTMAALRAGAISMGHVHVIVEAVSRLDGVWQETGPAADAFTAACGQLERRVLPVARRSTPGVTRAAARRAVLQVDPHGAHRRRQAARCTRDVYVIDEPDGIATLIARMATLDAHAILATVNQHATQLDAPSAGQARAQALADLVLHDAPTQVNLDVVIDLATLLGLRDDPATLTATGSGTGTEAGAVSAEEVRDLLTTLPPDAAVTVRRLVADPLHGHLLDVGRTRYRIPDPLRAFITARDRTCRFPGCRRPAHRCQVDHAQPWDDGGPTSRANLGALCTRHHQLKTHTGWQITASATDGSCTWQSPTGRTYHHHPPDTRGSSPPPEPD